MRSLFACLLALALTPLAVAQPLELTDDQIGALPVEAQDLYIQARNHFGAQRHADGLGSLAEAADAAPESLALQEMVTAIAARMMETSGVEGQPHLLMVSALAERRIMDNANAPEARRDEARATLLDLRERHAEATAAAEAALAEAAASASLTGAMSSQAQAEAAAAAAAQAAANPQPAQTAETGGEDRSATHNADGTPVYNGANRQMMALQDARSLQGQSQP